MLLRALPPLLAAAVALFTGVTWADAKGAARASVGAAYDTNAERVATDKRSDEAPTPDANLSLLGSLEGLWAKERGLLTGAYDVAARRFFRVRSEDAVFQAASLSGGFALTPSLRLGVDARLKDRRGGRPYTDLSARPYVDFIRAPTLEVRVSAGPHRFLNWEPGFFRYSFTGTEGGALVRYRFNRRHAVHAAGELGELRYHALARDATGEVTGAQGRRQDAVLSASAGYQYRGRVLASVHYSYLEQTSNSFGESYHRHRVAGALGLRLPWKLTWLSQGAVQQGGGRRFYSAELPMLEDEEDRNFVSTRLVRPLTEHIDLELKGALYLDELTQDQFVYARQVGGIGVTCRL